MTYASILPLKTSLGGFESCENTPRVCVSFPVVPSQLFGCGCTAFVTEMRVCGFSAAEDIVLFMVGNKRSVLLFLIQYASTPTALIFAGVVA